MDYEAEFEEETEGEEKEEGLRLLDFFEFSGTTIYPKANIADLLSEDQLNKLGACVKQGYETDIDTMSKWVELVRFGRELCKPETNSRSQPWQGACNYKSSLITDAALAFGDRASTELLRGKDLVQVNVIGKDPDEVKQKRADRVAVFENYQLNCAMKEWRPEQEKLLYDVPYSGTVFKKVYFDSTLGRNVSELICYPNFAVNNNTKSLETLRRFSELFVYPKNIVLEKIRSGLWLDNVSFGENDDDFESTTDQDPDSSENEQDQDTQFIEQQTWYDLDEDGYEEPYTVVIQASSSKVVRVVPRFELSDVEIKIELTEEQKVDSTLQDMIASGQMLDFDIVRIKAQNNLVMYGFIPSPTGEFLHVGYYHLLAQSTAAVNTLTNMLIDSGSLANLQGGYLAKGFRKKMGDAVFAPGQYIQTGLTAAEMKDGILPHPFKEPSITLYNMRNDMIGMASQSAANVDLKGALSPNAPAATTLALVNEQQLPASAIINRLYLNMGKEFELLYKLDAKFGSPQEYLQVVDDPEADFYRDFDLNGVDIVSSANPEVTSRMMRIQQANAELAYLDQVVAVGGDPRPIVKNYYEAIGSNVVDEVFPEKDPMQELEDLMKRSPEIAEMVTGARQQADAMAAIQLDQTAASTELMRADAERKRVEALEKVANLQTSASMNEAEVQKTRSETLLNLEKAETEATSNAIDKYTMAYNLDNPQEIMNAERDAK